MGVKKGSRISQSIRPLYMALRDKLLRDTQRETNPYRRLALTVRAADWLVDHRPAQIAEIERALFHVCVTLAG